MIAIKRSLTALLCLLLVLSMMPAIAFAGGPDAGAGAETDAGRAAKSGNVIRVGSAGYETLAEAVEKAQSGDEIVVPADCSDEGVISIANKSLAIRGEGAQKPVVKARFEIAHSDGNGPYTVSFENLRFVPAEADRVIGETSVDADSAENVNQLIVKDCEFYLTGDATLKSQQAAAVEIVGTAADGVNYVTGAKLTFTGNVIETDSFEDGGTGYYNAGISTSVTTGGSIYGGNVYSYAKHEISGNRFLGHLYYAYVGGYADFTGNHVNLKYGDAEIGEFGRAFQVRGAKAENHGGQLDLTVTGNTFQNMKEVFKLYELDSLMDVEGCWFEIAGSGGADGNVFVETTEGKIPSLGSAEGSAVAFGNMLYLEDIVRKDWGKIANHDMSFVLSSVELTKEGEPQVGKMTVEDGSQVNTYTQVSVPADGRTGFYVTIECEKYWYFATIYPGTVHYFLDDESNVYVTCLAGGSKVSEVKLSEDAEPAYEIMKENEGVFYKAAFSIITDSFDNTYYNAEVSEAEGSVTIEAADGKAAGDVNAFISDIGAYTSLYVTDDAAAAAPEGALKLVVPQGMGQILISCACPVEFAADVSNVNVIGRCEITVAEGSAIGSMEIDEAEANGTTLTNDGDIGSLFILAQTEVDNAGDIGSLSIGETRAGGLYNRQQKCARALDSIVRNEGNIDELQAVTRAEIYNGSEDGSKAAIDRLVIGGMGLLQDDGLPYATDSKIINYGVLCGTDSELDANDPAKDVDNDIYLFTRCYFENKGVIGREGRGPWDNHDVSECGGVGGVIYIGYYGYSDAHDGLVFVNSGTINAGARHNGAAHQCYTFFLAEGRSKDVSIEIYNADEGKAYGYALIFNDNVGDDLELNHTLVELGEPNQTDGLIRTQPIAEADYGAVDEALEKVPDDLSVYTDASVKALNEAIAAVVEGLDIRRQADVDEMAAAIEAAVAALEKKPEVKPDPGEEDPDDPGTGTDPGAGPDEPGAGTGDSGDGSESDEPSAGEEPKTGDDNNLALWIALLAAAGAAGAGAALKARKKN